MKYFTILALSTLSLAAPRPSPNIGAWSGPITTVCETTSNSPTYTDVQAASNHFKDNTYTCSHSAEGGNCEVMFQTTKASVRICGPTSLFECSAVYSATQSILRFSECVKSYNGVKRVAGKVVLGWGTVEVGAVRLFPVPIPVPGKSGKGGESGLVLDTGTPP